MEGFNTYINNTFTDCMSPENIMLNGYTVFLMSQPEYKEDIDIVKFKRMNWLINNYTEYENIDKGQYCDYYKKNICDNYNVSTKHIYEENQSKYIEDDIDIHYAELGIKYKGLADLNARMIAPENIYADDYILDSHTIDSDDNSDEIDSEYLSSQDGDNDFDMEDEYDEYLDNEYFEEDDYDW